MVAGVKGKARKKIPALLDALEKGLDDGAFQRELELLTGRTDAEQTSNGAPATAFRIIPSVPRARNSAGGLPGPPLRLALSTLGSNVSATTATSF